MRFNIIVLVVTIVSISAFLFLYFSGSSTPIGKFRQPDISVEKSEITLLKDLTDRLLEESDSDKILISKRRKDALLAIIEEQNLGTLKNIILPENIRQKFPVEVQENIEKDVVLEGEIEIVHIDDFEKGTAIYLYFINTNEGRFQIYSESPLPPTKGKVIVGAKQIGNKILIIT